MRFVWTKVGRIFAPGAGDWMASHAQSPLVEGAVESEVRVLFSGRDEGNRSHPGLLCFDLSRPEEPPRLHGQPLLDPGALGAFDDSGVMPSCLVKRDGMHYLYYTGWSRAVTTPFTFFIGLAVSNDGGATYERFSAAPVLGRNHNDPFLTAAPWVLPEGDGWRMWYVSGTGWEAMGEGEKPRHFYRIKHAASRDGVSWDTSPAPCIDYRPGEYALARPVVLRHQGRYLMWYSFRGEGTTYRIGYAESPDGLSWTRRDGDAGIGVSDEGWDAEMVCYACVFRRGDDFYMLYNGNGYGATGIGLARGRLAPQGTP